MFRCFVLYLLFVSCSARSNEINLIGDALAVENPCGNYVITVERLIGGPPDKEEYWDGTVNLQNYKNLSEAVVTVFLTSPGLVTVDDKNGKLSPDANPFNITFFKSKDDIFNARFHVRALPGQELPTLSGLQLNGEDICPNLDEVAAVVLEQLNNEINNKVSLNHAVEIGVKSICGIYFESSEIENKAITWPWSAVIYQNIDGNPSLRCGAVYIGKKSVLTTGHCVSGVDGQFDVGQLKVEIPFLTKELGVQIHSVKTLKVHHNFTYFSNDNDVAILEVDFSISNNNSNSAPCFWENSDENEKILDGSETYLTTKSSESSDIVRNRLWPTSREECPHNPTKNTVSTFCGKFDKDLEVCSEHEGSGVFVKIDNQYFLQSLLTVENMEKGAHQCMNTNIGTYIDLSDFNEWILKNIL